MVTYNINWEELYEQYKNGKSLRQLADELNIVHSTIRVNFKKLNLQRRTLSEAQTGEKNHEWKNGKSSKNGRTYLRLSGPKIARSHLVYCNFYNIEKIPEGYCIHHKDSNPSNDNIENLELISNSEHMKQHEPWKYTKLHKQKIKDRML